MRCVACTMAAAAVAASAGAGAAGARPAGFAVLHPGDTLAVRGAPLACEATATAIACRLTGSAGARPGAWAVLLRGAGEGRLQRMGTDGALADAVVRRPARADARVSLGLGQVARLRSAALPRPLDCAVVRSAGLLELYCSSDDAVGPVPGTVAVLLNARQAALGRIASDRGTTVTDLRTQPR